MIEDKNIQAAPATDLEVNADLEVSANQVPEPEDTKIQDSIIIIPETDPEVNGVDQELIFHAPDEEGEDND